MMKRLISYFLQGILFTVPIAATIYVLYYLLNRIDSIIPFNIPGLGIVVIIVILTFFGYLSTFYFANPLFAMMERMLDKAPLAKTIYTSVKDLISAFVGDKKTFTQPVLVTLNKDSCLQQVGFITQNDLTHLGMGPEKIAVYLPFSYSFMGGLYIVPRENVSPINSSGTDMMKFIISGGVSELEK